MGIIKKFYEYFKIEEGAIAEPTVRPTVKPGIKQAPRRPSPLRRDKPSVEPGPKAVSEIDLANKFLGLTKNNKKVQDLLRKKYTKQ